jgi:hypothetical protein
VIEVGRFYPSTQICNDWGWFGHNVREGGDI